ncbi:MAG: hypothetical protein JXB49_00775 [Bacteroidales bacterium]|nr:hypothetical protein [Bacteroidales bacterium]
MKPYHFTCIIALTVVFNSCVKQKEPIPVEEPIARVLDKKLYSSDIIDAIPNELSTEDSLGMVRSLVDKWIRKQLMLNKAESNLTDDQKDVQKKLDDYRTSLLIFTYEQKLLEEELDTTISDEEIQEYYNENGSNFILAYDLVKAILIKLPVQSNESYNIRRIYRSDMDPHEIRNLSNQYSASYEDYNNSWVLLSSVLKDIPYNVNNYETFLKYRKSIEARDTSFYYFFHVRDFRLRSEVAPIDYVDENIRAILLNKRKVQFIRQLESHIYEDAKNRGLISTY